MASTGTGEGRGAPDATQRGDSPGTGRAAHSWRWRWRTSGGSGNRRRGGPARRRVGHAGASRRAFPGSHCGPRKQNCNGAGQRRCSRDWSAWARNGDGKERNADMDKRTSRRVAGASYPRVPTIRPAVRTTEIIVDTLMHQFHDLLGIAPGPQCVPTSARGMLMAVVTAFAEYLWKTGIARACHSPWFVDM